MKNQRCIKPVELLEMLDLEERISFANELRLTPPKNLSDPTFLNDVSQFSATTLLSAIVRIRRPFMNMLQEIYQFLERKETSGRTTTRTVVLPSAQKELRLHFSPALKAAVATTLSSRIGSAGIDSLGERTKQVRERTEYQMNNIRGSDVQSETNVSRVMRQMKHDPAMRMMARRFDRGRHVYHSKDLKLVEELYKQYKKIIETINRIVQAADNDDWIPMQIIEETLQNLKEGFAVVQSKHRNMRFNEPSFRDRADPRREIDDDEWNELRESMKVLREEILAACDFQTNAKSIVDFFNLELWRERWRIYELWTLTHLLRVFENVGFGLDMSGRILDGVWNLKFTKDQYPVAILISENVTLEVYYQLYVKGIESGDMPDIAIKKKDGEFLLVLDPKHGMSYDLSKLTNLSYRYARAFVAKQTIIHNFYPMTYTYELVSENPRCLVVSDISPNSGILSKLHQDIFLSIPDDWLPEGDSLVILVDISGSTQPLRNRISQAVEKALREHSRRTLPSSVLILFDDRIVKETLLSNIHNINELLNDFTGGGTNIASAIDTGIEKLMALNAHRSLLLFTDGNDSIDIVSVSQKINQAGIQLQIYEAVDSGNTTLLQKLTQITGGRHYRI